MTGKATKMFLMAVFAAVPLFFCARFLMDAPASYRTASLSRQEPTRVLERLVRQYLPMKQQLQQLSLELRLAGGRREQKGIFISEEGLMRDITPPLEKKIEENSEAINAFAARLTEGSDGRKNTYLAIVPTASGVLLDNLPRFAQSQMIDQQRQIESVYADIAMGVRTVDTYSALQSQRDQYIYYRTDDRLTSLGGYYAYTAVARRMGLNVRSLSQFRVEYVSHDYYGNLYQQPSDQPLQGQVAIAPYRKVRPDMLALYHYTGRREYMVSLSNYGKQHRYHSLYPTHMLDLGYPMAAYLGIPSAITDVRTSATYSGRLLVFGDNTALMCLPYLSTHYQQVTLVDLLNARAVDLEGLYPEQFDHVLFLYGIENYIHTDTPSQVRYVPWRQDSD